MLGTAGAGMSCEGIGTPMRYCSAFLAFSILLCASKMAIRAVSAAISDCSEGALESMPAASRALVILSDSRRVR